MNKKYETGLFATNANFIEEIYSRYLEQPLSVEKDWREAFDEIQVTRNLKRNSLNSGQETPVANSSLLNRSESKHIRKQLTEIANSYRAFGHMAATLDPLDMHNNRQNSNLALHDLDDNMLDEEIDLNGELGIQQDKLLTV
jgi:2-oxoglutarate dehydrogenase E1 component